MTFSKRLNFLVLTFLKYRGTSGLTGSKGHRGQASYQEERPSKTMTFSKRLIFLALTFLKYRATSGLTGSRGHRGQPLYKEERPSKTFIFGERIMVLALTCFKWGATSCLTGSRGHRGHAMCHEERPSLTFTFGKRTKLISQTVDFLLIFEYFYLEFWVACNLTPDDVIMTSSQCNHLCIRVVASCIFDEDPSLFSYRNCALKSVHKVNVQKPLFRKLHL